MRVIQAKSAGFCYGVRRAVELAEKAVEAGPVVMLGPIIHNDHVIAALRDKGAVCVESVEEVPEGATVLIRSHGEPQWVYEALKAKNATILDATCPNVSQIHKIVAEAEARGRIPVIVGTPTHPEVTAIAGWCRNSGGVSDPDTQKECVKNTGPLSPKPQRQEKKKKNAWKKQKKSVQTPKYLIQYVVLLQNGSLRHRRLPRTVTGSS